MSATLRIDATLLKRVPLPMPDGATDKNSRGRVLVVGGARRCPGAALLSGMASLRVGAGKLQLALPRSIGVAAGMTILEAGICELDENDDGEMLVSPESSVLTLARNSDAVLIGPGILSEEAARDVTRLLLSEVVGPVYVLDALALCDLWSERDLLEPHSGRIVLTPHAGEMAQLAGLDKEEVEANPLAIAREAAGELGSVVVLKGGNTFIAMPTGSTFRYDDGVVGLATAGSGDVLAGMLAGIVSRGAEPLVAAMWSVFMHGEAGRKLTREVGALGFVARELLHEVPALMESLR